MLAELVRAFAVGILIGAAASEVIYRVTSRKAKTTYGWRG